MDDKPSCNRGFISMGMNTLVSRSNMVTYFSALASRPITAGPILLPRNFSDDSCPIGWVNLLLIQRFIESMSVMDIMKSTVLA